MIAAYARAGLRGLSVCVLLFLCACEYGAVSTDGPADAAVRVPPWGFGGFYFRNSAGRAHAVYLYRAERFDPRRGPIWFVMHGAKRDAVRYLRLAAPIAERFDALAVAIRYSREQYPTGDAYTLGIEANSGASPWLNWAGPDPDDAGPYQVIDAVYQALRTELSGEQAGYYLYGHSAGGQFVHRLVMFSSDSRVLRAVAANAGWYTLPDWGETDQWRWPYGLTGSRFSRAQQAQALQTPLIILLGTDDRGTAQTDPLLRDSPAAAMQGADRFGRGQHFFDTAQRAARVYEVPLAWRLQLAPGAGHSAAETIASAGHLLFGSDSAPCQASPGAEGRDLVITELLADPSEGEAGDSNRDGRRDPSEDEFVELHNAGDVPVCLSGWSLRDASGRRRHLFPLASALPPGGTVVVFGGGIPMGRFAGSQVQTATSGLGLRREGDVLALFDHHGRLVMAVSWGDCDGARCARSHIDQSLAIRGSVLRWPEPRGTWRRHDTVAQRPASPGVRADGRAWK